MTAYRERLLRNAQDPPAEDEDAVEPAPPDNGGEDAATSEDEDATEQPSTSG